MNPDRIYRQHRDDALAKQVTAHEYTTFVAMPFGNRFSYRPSDVFENVICAAAKKANELSASRPFARPHRVDQAPGVAANITEDIVVGILESHLFLADLTFANHGVLIEIGLALGLKPTRQIILIFQGERREVHFDINHNRILNYDSRHVSDSVDEIATALIAGAKGFEEDRARYVKAVTRSLSSDAIHCMNWYGQAWKANPVGKPALHRGFIELAYHQNPPHILFPNVPDVGVAAIIFTEATRELVDKRLFYTEYQPKGVPEGDTFGMHATELGWLVIAKLWPELEKPRQVEDDKTTSEQ